MERSGRRILVAVEPGVLEGALARLLSSNGDDMVVQRSIVGRKGAGGYDAAVVSDRLPIGVRADVVITLPDTRGSGGIGTVRKGTGVWEVSITCPDRIIELLSEHLPRSRST